jgi:hypothetical protein
MQLREWFQTVLTLLLLLPICSFAATDATAHTTQQLTNGARDFDFETGTWTTHIRRLLHPLSGSTVWVRAAGTVQIHKLWGGKGQIEEIEAGSPATRFESLTVFLYDPQSRQWRMYFANSNDGVLSVPCVGEFHDGRGEFYDQEPYHGRMILVRVTWSDITPNSHRFEQAFSDDGGRTWETNFIAVKTRVKPGEALMQPKPVGSESGQHDFDWQLGNWNVRMSRLEQPLTTAKTWTHLDGTVRVHKIWNGRANLAEIDARGPSGHLQFLSLRLFNPQTRQWSLNFASSNSGIMSQPMVGEFKHGRGDFYDQELFNGRAILVRFSFLGITSESGRDEQAFSLDGGRTWQTNWINESTRMKGSEGASDDWGS